jgi:murein DD-endopeptidase MepM/ murein hydrolase activator NlpD
MKHSGELGRGAGLVLLAASVLTVCGLRRDSRAAAPAATVSWAPTDPVQGSAVVVVVSPGAESLGADTLVAVRGTLAGEPLPFERDRDGRFRALGALPANARARTLLPLVFITAGGDTVHQTAHIFVGDGEFRTEHLRLPPHFVRPPDSLLQRLRGQRRAIREALARAGGTPRLWDGAFMRPVNGRITDRFGTGRVLNGDARSHHLGVDLSARRGTPIHAANRGVVLVADRFYYQGNAVYIDHGTGLVTSYMHMSHLLVAAGDTVEAGQVIGLAGATGRVTGPHLHWGAYFGRVQFNPLSLLTLPAADLAAFTS